MGKRTNISWTTHTWNPWQGCHKVSLGCKHCYAETLVEKRMGRKFTEIRRSAPTTFSAPLKWNREFVLKNPVGGPRPKEYVFACSISDFFIEEADAWRDEAWEIIRRTPHLTYQILTKRPERIAECLPRTCFHCGVDTIEYLNDCLRTALKDGPIVTKWKLDNGEIRECCRTPSAWPWPNVWLGTSVENQRRAEERIPRLVAVPAVVHFLSCEPLLGPIDFGMMEPVLGPGNHALLNDIEWIIIGGESGPNYRKMELDWARSIRDQCKAAGVPFFGKQDSGSRSEIRLSPDLDIREMP